MRMTDIPNKLDYLSLPNHSSASWHNEEDIWFTDLEIEFRQRLTPQQKTEVIKHFVNGFEAYQAQHEYCIVYLNWFDDSILTMTFQSLEVSRTRSLFALMVDLRQLFPVARMGNQVYDP
jgi:hypothetical protein